MRQNFYSFLAEINNIKPNIIVLSEVWIGSDELQNYKISGYKTVGKCNDSYRAGGVVCFVSEDVDCVELEFEMESADCLLLELKISNFRFYLISIYRMQCFPINYFVQELEQNISQFKLNTVYIGDINVDILKHTPEVNNYTDVMSNNSFVSLVNIATRITERSSSCVDHIYTKFRQNSIFKSAVFDVNVTDHCLLGLTMNLLRPETGNEKIKSKVSYDYVLINDNLQSLDWSIVYDKTDVNQCYGIFFDTLSDVVSKNVIKPFTITKLDKARAVSPWMNTNILKRIKKRQKLYQTIKKRPYDLKFKKYYETFANKLKNDIDIEKNNYHVRLIDKCNGDSGQQWKVINNLVGKSDNKNVNKIILNDGTCVDDPQLVAEELNRYLISAHSSDTGLANPTSFITHNNNPNSFFLLPTDCSEILKIISLLKNKKSTGYDNFGTILVKKIAHSIAPVLLFIINLSFSLGIFPEALKRSIVVPLFKKRNSYSIDNIRPISLVPVFSKIFEKCMKVRFLCYLKSINFQSRNQFGFTVGKSTEDALISFVSNIYASFNNKHKSTGLFIDFKKAFDFVDHQILLSKLESIGIRGNALKWFESFLSNRVQQVRVDNKLSAPLVVNAGVPQGCVLSANLFIVFINDLLTSNFKGKIFAFADDIAFLYTNKAIPEIFSQLTNDLKILRTWCSNNKMVLNTSKTNFINFSHNSFNFENIVRYHKTNCSENIPCQCPALEKVDSFKYLGVYLDENLSWKRHVSVLQKQVKSNIRKFYFLRNFCHLNLLRTLYFGLIHSRIQYGVVCWGGTYKTFIDSLRKTQNYFIRIITKKK